jgi:hypothetical protein
MGVAHRFRLQFGGISQILAAFGPFKRDRDFRVVGAFKETNANWGKRAKNGDAFLVEFTVW